MLACGGGIGTRPPGNTGGEGGEAGGELSDAGADSGGAAQSAGTRALGGEAGVPSSLGGQGGGGLSECEPACEAPEQCNDGVCECPHDLCDGICKDTQADEFNCGACGTFCGDGDCVNGTCECPTPLVSCQLETYLLSCRDLQLDELACGECGVTCESSVLCVEGACDATVEWVRIYGAETIDGRPALLGRLVADAQGNLFAAIGLGPGLYSELPDGEASLWQGGTSIIKLDHEGTFQWAVPSESLIRGLAITGSDLWVLGYATATTTVAGQTFDLASGHTAMTIALKLSGDSHQVIDSFQLDHVTRDDRANPQLLADGSELWVVDNGGAMKLANTSWQPPSPAYGAYIYPRGGSPVWLPGTRLGAVQGGGDLVVLTDLAKDQSYSFGGDTLTTGAMGARGIARYSSSLAHESSFLIDWHWLSDGVFTASDSYYFILGLPQKPFFQQYDGSGILLPSTDPPLDAYSVHTRDNRIYAAGYVLLNGGTVGEREFQASAAWLGTFNATTQELERAITFEPELPTELMGPPGVLDMVVTDDGASAIVLTSFKRGILFRHQQYDFGNNTTGFALVKVKLY